MRYQRHRLNQTGFTIIELMIATTVLSTMLLLVTVIMISIGNLYYKGINQARVQDDVHSITDEVSQHLQLSGTSTPIKLPSDDNKTFVYCIGDTSYVFTLGVQIGTGADIDGTSQSQHVLWRDKTPASGCTKPPSPSGPSYMDSSSLLTDYPTGTELIAPNSRLTDFCISGSVANSCKPDASPYTISVGVAYGAIDLLNLSGVNSTCKGNIGDQFCATASLTTTVAQRLTP